MLKEPVTVIPASIDPEGFRIMAKILGYTDRMIDEHIERDKAFNKKMNEMYPIDMESLR